MTATTIGMFHMSLHTFKWFCLLPKYYFPALLSLYRDLSKRAADLSTQCPPDAAIRLLWAAALLDEPQPWLLNPLLKVLNHCSPDDLDIASNCLLYQAHRLITDVWESNDQDDQLSDGGLNDEGYPGSKGWEDGEEEGGGSNSSSSSSSSSSGGCSIGTTIGGSSTTTTSSSSLSNVTGKGTSSGMSLPAKDGANGTRCDEKGSSSSSSSDSDTYDSDIDNDSELSSSSSRGWENIVVHNMTTEATTEAGAAAVWPQRLLQSAHAAAALVASRHSSRNKQQQQQVADTLSLLGFEVRQQLKLGDRALVIDIAAVPQARSSSSSMGRQKGMDEEEGEVVKLALMCDSSSRCSSSDPKELLGYWRAVDWMLERQGWVVLHLPAHEWKVVVGEAEDEGAATAYVVNALLQKGVAF